MTKPTIASAARDAAIWDVVGSSRFLDDLIKSCEEAEDVLLECGRLRLLRTVAAGIRLYQDVRISDVEKEQR
jgi:hypothetical protein